VGLTTLHRKNKLVTINEIEPRTWTDYVDKRPKRRNMDMRLAALEDLNKEVEINRA
jgi:hypothetical protein